MTRAKAKIPPLDGEGRRGAPGRGELRISPAAHATITRPLIYADGRFNRGAISAKAQRDFRAGYARTWSKAMENAWDLAHRQLDNARQYDADRRAFYRAPIARKRTARDFPQHAA